MSCTDAELMLYMSWGVNHYTSLMKQTGIIYTLQSRLSTIHTALLEHISEYVVRFFYHSRQ